MKKMKVTSIYGIEPINGRKSFYGKAKVIVAGGWSFLKSYDTIMCGVEPCGRIHRYSGHDSNTTRSHLISFLDGEYKGFWDLPCEDCPKITIEI